MQISLTILAVYVVYEVVSSHRTGATPGKKAVGISVRLRDQARPPPMKVGPEGTRSRGRQPHRAFLPSVLRPLGSLFTLFDVLWPLWDDKKQAIHDKVVGTNVVVGPQPRRDA